MARPSRLAIHPRDMVLNLLNQSTKPMSAYQLFENLKSEGVGGVTIIYRALEALEKAGTVHKIKELSAYIACNCIEDHKTAMALLTVCCTCHKVEEIDDKSAKASFQKIITSKMRLQNHAVLEVPIVCDDCSV